MMRLVNLVLVAAVLVSAWQVYRLEIESRTADGRLIALKENIAEERETIRRLRAEWSHLNTPARLEKLAMKHLQHERGPVSQVVRLHEIGDRVPALQGGGRSEMPDPIAEMLAGNAGMTTGSATPRRKEPDLIADILKGLQ